MGEGGLGHYIRGEAWGIILGKEEREAWGIILGEGEREA